MAVKTVGLSTTLNMLPTVARLAKVVQEAPCGHCVLSLMDWMLDQADTLTAEQFEELLRMVASGKHPMKIRTGDGAYVH